MRQGKRKLLGCCRPISIVHAQQPLRPFRSGEGRKGRGIIGKSGGADTTAAENPGRGSLSKYSNKFLGEEEAGGPEGAIHIFPALLSIGSPFPAGLLTSSKSQFFSPARLGKGRSAGKNISIPSPLPELLH